MTTTAELRIVTSALTRLHEDARSRDWAPDTGRDARPGCWHDDDHTSQFTVVAVGDLAVTRVEANTPDGSIRTVITGSGHEQRAIDLLRRFLGWPEEDS